MKITVVADLQEEPGFLPEFGLSLLLQTSSGEYLFDIGAGNALNCNLRQPLPECRIFTPRPGRTFSPFNTFKH